MHRAGNAWRCSIMVNGRRVSSTHRTKAEAESRRMELAYSVAAGSEVRSETLGFIAQAWIRHVESTTTATTVDLYEYALKPFAVLYDVDVAHIRPFLLQDLLNGLSGRRSQMAYDKLSQCLSWAIKMGLAVRSPLDGVDRPRHERGQIEVFSPEESRVIVEASRGETLGAAIRLGLAVGLRGGEVWGLQWDDWKQSRLSIQRQVSCSGGKVNVRPPKRDSARVVSIPDKCIADLKALRQTRRQRGLAGCPWVFPTAAGQPMRRTTFAAGPWTRVLKGAGLSHRGFHHLRHTCATMLLNRGVPVLAVAKLLGHKDASVTLRIYAHLISADLDEHRNTLDDLF